MKRISYIKRKYFKKAASFLAVICCLAGNILPAGLASGTVLAAPPRVVFENTEKAEPYLYISKETESAMAGMEIPEDQKGTPFTFALKMNGELQAYMEYTLFDYDPTNGGSSDGGEQSDGSDAPEVIFRNGKRYVEDKRPEADPYRTGKDGEFTLEAGQMARFYIGQRNAYEVSEVAASMPENFRLARTEGDTAGTMTKSGKFVTFVNQWMPAEVPGETTRLEVEKQVVFLDRYDSPEALFPFQLELMGLTAYEPYANQPYMVVDAANANTPVVIKGVTDEKGMALTDPDGIFYLKDGCKAVFQKVPNGTEYRVKELLDPDDKSQYPRSQEDKTQETIDGGQPEAASENGAKVELNAVLDALQPQHWRLASDTKQVQESVTKAPLTQNIFKNINTAFVVTKSVENPTGQDENLFKDASFTFLLTKEDGTVWPYVRYYLYDTAGKPVMEKDPVSGTEVIVTHHTDVNGKFTLQLGQAAVFFAERDGKDGSKGIAPGISYTVKEEPRSGFRQSVPKAVDTYTNMEVKADSVNNHPFVNEVKEPGGLTVTKKVENVKGEAPLSKDDVFTFVLKDGGGNPIQSNYSVIVGGTTNTGRTDENGYFTLKIGETAEFDKNMVTPGEYIIQEVENFPSGYWFNRVEWRVRGGASNIQDADSTIRDEDMNTEGRNGNGESRSRDTDLAENSRKLQISGVNDESDITDSDDSNVSIVIPPGGNKQNSSEINDPIPITLTEDGLDVVYYNNYAPDRTDIVLTKMDNTVEDSGNPWKGHPLANAEFRLYRVETVDGEEVETEVVKDKIYTTKANGTLNIEDLSSGTYRLKETKAPEGYMIMEPIEIIIDRKGKPGGEAEVKVNGTAVPADHTQLSGSREDPDRLACAAQFISSMKLEDGDSPMPILSLVLPGASQAYQAADDQLILYAYDDYLYELPHSGGNGIYWYLIGGVLLMMAAALILYKDKMKYAGRLR